MATVTEQHDYRSTPEALWTVVGSPDALSDWHPAIAASPVSDGVRRTTLVGGGELVELIVEHSDEDRFYVYDITEGPFPMRSYRSRIAVEAADGGSRIVWRADFEPDDPASEQQMMETFAGIYRAGLEAVQDRLQGETGSM